MRHLRRFLNWWNGPLYLATIAVGLVVIFVLAGYIIAKG